MTKNDDAKVHLSYSNFTLIYYTFFRHKPRWQAYVALNLILDYFIL